jgi:hypothetical protein
MMIIVQVKKEVENGGREERENKEGLNRNFRLIASIES